MRYVREMPGIIVIDLLFHHRMLRAWNIIYAAVYFERAAIAIFCRIK